MALGMGGAVPSGSPAPGGPVAWGPGPILKPWASPSSLCARIPGVFHLNSISEAIWSHWRFPPEQHLGGHLVTLLHFTGGKTDIEWKSDLPKITEKISKKDRPMTPECAGRLQKERAGRRECEDPLTRHQAASQMLSGPCCI